MRKSIKVIDGKAVIGGVVIGKSYPRNEKVKICIDDDSKHTIFGEVYIDSFWASIYSIHDILFCGITKFDIDQNGQYRIYGKTTAGSPSFIEDGCLQDECNEPNCDYCNIAQRQNCQYTLPVGLIVK